MGTCGDAGVSRFGVAPFPSKTTERLCKGVRVVSLHKCSVVASRHALAAHVPVARSHVRGSARFAKSHKKAPRSRGRLLVAGRLAAIGLPPASRWQGVAPGRYRSRRLWPETPPRSRTVATTLDLSAAGSAPAHV